jgi:hypothetical protein
MILSQDPNMRALFLWHDSKRNENYVLNWIIYYT